MPVGNWTLLVIGAALVGVPIILTVAVLYVWGRGSKLGVHLFRLGQNAPVLKIIQTSHLPPSYGHTSGELQSLGLLCATVAHDFSNLLSVILANAASLKSSTNAQAAEEAEEIEQAALEAADLCRRLLSLGREGSSESEAASLNRLVEAELPLLRRLVSRQVLLLWEPGPDLCVDAARTEFRQLLLNLCANARDAMPAGGDLRLSTTLVQRSLSDNRGSTTFGCLSVRDNGTGMDEVTQARLFEPFFTTKGPKQGTGLGMAVVAAAAARHNASIEIESQVGTGTRISILFPLLDSQLDVRPSHVRATALPLDEGTAPNAGQERMSTTTLAC